MKRCKTHLVRVCVFLLAAVPAYCQRGTLGIDLGQTSDKFDTLSSVNGLELGFDGQVTVLKATAKRPSIVAGGEIRLPRDTGTRESMLCMGDRVFRSAISRLALTPKCEGSFFPQHLSIISFLIAMGSGCSKFPW